MTAGSNDAVFHPIEGELRRHRRPSQSPPKGIVSRGSFSEATKTT